MRELLEGLEASSADGAGLAIPLAYLASPYVPQEAAELNAALRRAELLLATGGDPRRDLDLDSRAVTALAADLDSAPGRAALVRALRDLADQAEGLPRVGEALRSLLGDGELAWRCYASAILADVLAGD